jgi:hypothetical protein
MTKAKIRVGERLAEGDTLAKRFIIPRYVKQQIREMSPPYGSQGRAIQVGLELLARIQFHPVPINDSLKRGIPGAEEKIGMTYKLVPRSIALIDKFTEVYGTKAGVFEALITLLSRKFIA